MEYCFTESGTLGPGGMLVACRPGTQGAWGHSLSYNLGSDSPGTNATVYGEYRVVVVDSSGNATAYPSFPGSAPFYYLTGSLSNAVANSPVGNYDPNFTGSAQNQLQYINCTVGQWVTWYATSQTTVYACTPNSCPAETIVSQTTPYYIWPGTNPDDACAFPGPTGAYIYTPDLFVSGSASTFQQFNPNDYTTSPFQITCIPPGGSGTEPNPTTCGILADGTGEGSYAGDMPGDEPSPSIPAGTCGNSNVLLFSGYADASMRADALISSSNPSGSILWMSYSWPEFQTQYNAGSGTTTCTPALEVHLTTSNSISVGGYPSGWQWTAECGTDTNSKCSTPLFPSPTTNSSNNPAPFTGTTTVLCTTSGCAGGHTLGQTFQVSGIYYSSHEVSNLAQYVGGPYWYAVHSMYFVPEGYTVQNGLVNGCLVISGPASSPNGPAPAGLMWPNYTNENPASCSADDSNWAAYTNSYPLEYSSLNALVAANGAPNPGCATWGEPALMAAAAPRGHSGEWLYLAAECLTFAPGTANYVGTTGYFVFYTPIGSDGSVSGTWAAYPPAADDLGAMNFTICAVPGQPYGCGSTAMYFLDELDWAVRADGSMVAVAVPDEVPTNGQPTQGPCLAMTFDLYQPYDNPTGSPFTALVAQVYDQDTLTPSNLLYSAEESSPNGCTYEPQSNTGIPIVRHLVATQSGVQPTQYQTYSIVNSGVMP